MTRSLAARLVLSGIAVVVWGYGYRSDAERMRLVAIALLALALLLRFVPGRWTGDKTRPPAS